MIRDVQIAFWSFLLFALVSGTAASQDSAFELNAQGVRHYEAQDWSRAQRAFERAIRLAPDNNTIRRNLSNAYQAHAAEMARSKQYADGIELLELAIRMDPENPNPYVQLGAYYLYEGLIADAIFRLEEAIELSPFDVDAHFLLGEAYYRDNDLPAARDQWRWVKQVEPDREGLQVRLDAVVREQNVEQAFQSLSSSHFNVTYNPRTDSYSVRRVLEILESAYLDIGRALGGAYPPAPIQVTLYSASGFAESTLMGEHVGALFDGTKIRVPVVDRHGNLIEEEELKRRLYHEYVHVVVRHVAREGAPWWLNEGLAELLSRELTGSHLSFLRKAKREKSLFPIERLTEGQLERLDLEALQVAYRQSHAAVALLKERYGMRRLAALLEALGEGEEPERALRVACRFSYRTLDLALADFIENGRS